MKKTITKTNLLVVLLMLLIASLIGATTTMHLAHAQEEEPKSTVEFTSYTSVLNVGETFTFAAQATLPDGTVTDALTWTSSDNTVITMLGNIALATAEGNATITATAADGGSASVNVLVSNSAVRVESIRVFPTVLELGVGWTLRMDYTIIPQDAYEQRATWASSDPSVVTVDANGNVEAVAAGSATITVTSIDNQRTATVPVTVYADLEEATISPDTYTMMIGGEYDLLFSLPEGVSLATDTTIRWYSLEDSIASLDRIVDLTGTVYAWDYGTTMIYATAHGDDGKVYGATATIHVTAQFYYLTGLEEVLEDPTDPNANPWVTYKTEEEARAAGVLLEQSEENPYVYSITRSLWAYDYFQILHDNMDLDPNWVTKITSTYFNEDGSSMNYVSNTVDSFGVSALGVYTITLDLSDGRAQVTIEMESLNVTSFDLSIAEGSKSYLQYVCAEEGAAADAARTLVLDAYTIPEAAAINLADVTITTEPSVTQYVTIEPEVIKAEATGYDVLQITLTLLDAPAANIPFQLITEINNNIAHLSNPTDDINLIILANDEVYAPVKTVAFTNTQEYLVNVNNGATEWVSSTPIEAIVNADATVQGVVYSELSDHIYIEYRDVDPTEEVDLKPFVHADALGTYTIYATSLGANEEGDTVTAETTVLVTSLIETEAEGETTYSTGFYLIGQLNGRTVENWTSIPPTQTTFGTSEFANWTLPLVEGQLKVYTTSVHLEAYDRFSIAFLGMDGNWGGVINANYMDWANSVGNYYESDGNVQTTVSGEYFITLNLSYERPFFRVDLVEEDTSTYNLNLYIVRGGDSWDPTTTEQGNILATVGYIEIVNGVAQSFTLTLDKFTIDVGEAPVIQFVTARGIEGGYFYGETWYGESYTAMTFGGDAYSATGEAGHFTNRDGNSVLFWVSDPAQAAPVTVSFTFKFNDAGVLTNVDVNPVTEETAE